MHIYIYIYFLYQEHNHNNNNNSKKKINEMNIDFNVQLPFQQVAKNPLASLAALGLAGMTPASTAGINHTGKSMIYNGIMQKIYENGFLSLFLFRFYYC